MQILKLLLIATAWCLLHTILDTSAPASPWSCIGEAANPHPPSPIRRSSPIEPATKLQANNIETTMNLHPNHRQNHLDRRCLNFAASSERLAEQSFAVHDRRDGASES